MIETTSNNLYIPDTNALLDSPNIVLEYKCILTHTVLRELTALEMKRDKGLLQKMVRDVKHAIRKGIDSGNVDIQLTDKTHDLSYTNDEIILQEVIDIQKMYDETIVLITSDILMTILADRSNIPHTNPTNITKEELVAPEGVYEFMYDPDNTEHQETLSKIVEVSNLDLDVYYNPFNLKRNQYLVVWDTSKREEDRFGVKTYKEAGTYRFNGLRLVPLKFSNIHTGFEKFRPVNVRQRLAFDMMQDNDIKVKMLTGGFGTGKDAVMVSHALHMIKEGYFDKLIWIRNNIEVKDTNPIGHLPDGMEDKLKPFVGPLIDKVGGDEGYRQIEDKVTVEHLGSARGREYKNSIIYVTEAQTNTRDHIKLLLGRVGEGSEIWFNGDTKQTDNRKFEYDNGIKALTELTGHELFGHVTLDKVERSEAANLANLLDI